MRLVVDFLHSLHGNVGVDLSSGEAGMTEEFLHGAEVGPVVEEVGGEAVTELVGADVEGDAGKLMVFS